MTKGWTTSSIVGGYEAAARRRPALGRCGCGVWRAYRFRVAPCPMAVSRSGCTGLALPQWMRVGSPPRRTCPPVAFINARASMGSTKLT